MSCLVCKCGAKGTQLCDGFLPRKLNYPLSFRTKLNIRLPEPEEQKRCNQPLCKKCSVQGEQIFEDYCPECATFKFYKPMVKKYD